MNKGEFLRLLGTRLSVLPQTEAERLMEFYAELIEDKMENGETEEQAVANLGPIDELVQGILQEEEIEQRKTEEKGSASNGFGRRLAIAICTFPIWLPLYISAWAVVVSLYASAAGLLLSGLFYVIPSLVVCGQSVAVGFFQLGICLAAMGIGIYLLAGTIYCTKYFCRFTRFLWNGIRYSFYKGGERR